MTLPETIKQLDFDRFRLFFRDQPSRETFLLDHTTHHRVMERAGGSELTNSILMDGRLNPAFQEIPSSAHPDLIQQLLTLPQAEVFPAPKNVLFNVALLFERQEAIVGGIQLDPAHRVGQTLEGETVFLTQPETNYLLELLHPHGAYVAQVHLPPFLAVSSHWHHYRFPKEFYFNPITRAYETGLNSYLMCHNFERIRLEIAPVNGQIMPWQIDRVAQLDRNRFKINNQLKDAFWEDYNRFRDDYELPSLDTKDQLNYFVSLILISVSENPEEPVFLSFTTWDEEHGQSVNFYPPDEVDFE